MDKAALLALADRVEALIGPDRMIDAEIAWLTKWRWAGWEEGDLAIEDRDLAAVQDRVQHGHNSVWLDLPRYTSSLDAAETLIPDAWNWMAGNRNQPLARAYVENGHPAFVGFGASLNPNRLWFEVVAATPALALAAAALRASVAS